ncbi:MAG: hypothetical protein IJW69_04740 [Clostridia bacterium]|nr:hypothetical protein [Clostridia bacterium]
MNDIKRAKSFDFARFILVSKLGFVEMAPLRPMRQSLGQAFLKACRVWGGAPRKRRFFAKLSLRLGCQRKRLNCFAKAKPLLVVSTRLSDAFFFAYRGTKKKALQKRNADLSFRSLR